MFAPIFKICSSDSSVLAILGANPTRLYPFGEAPENVPLPYAVWQSIGGSPENYINQAPDIDRYTIQVDVYAVTEYDARQAAKALRDAIEPYAHIIGWRGEFTDPDTKDKRYSFDSDWFVNR